MTLYIKNMVCRRCKMAVEDVLSTLSIEAISVELGEVRLEADLTPIQLQQLSLKLHSIGFRY